MVSIPQIRAAGKLMKKELDMMDAIYADESYTLEDVADEYRQDERAAPSTEPRPRNIFRLNTGSGLTAAEEHHYRQFISDAHTVVDDTEVSIPADDSSAADGRLKAAVEEVQGAVANFVTTAELFLAVEKSEALFVAADIPGAAERIREAESAVAPALRLFGRKYCIQKGVKLFGYHVCRIFTGDDPAKKFVAAMRTATNFGEVIARRAITHQKDVTVADAARIHEWRTLSRARRILVARLIETSTADDPSLKFAVEAIVRSRLRFLGCAASKGDEAAKRTSREIIKTCCRSVRRAALKFIAQNGLEKNPAVAPLACFCLDPDEAETRKEVLAGDGKAVPSAAMTGDVWCRVVTHTGGKEEQKRLISSCDVQIYPGDDSAAIRVAAGTKTSFLATIPDEECLPLGHVRTRKLAIAAMKAVRSGGKTDTIAIHKFPDAALKKDPVIQNAVAAALRRNRRKVLLLPSSDWRGPLIEREGPATTKVVGKEYYPPDWEILTEKAERNEPDEEESDSPGELEALLTEERSFPTFRQLRWAFQALCSEHQNE
eukprot:g18120.t1